MIRSVVVVAGADARSRRAMFTNGSVRGAGDGHQQIGAAGTLVRKLAPERLHVVVAGDALRSHRGGKRHVVVAHGYRHRCQGRAVVVVVTLGITGHVARHVQSGRAGLMLQVVVLLLLLPGLVVVIPLLVVIHAGVEEVGVGCLGGDERAGSRGVQMMVVVPRVVVRVERVVGASQAGARRDLHIRGVELLLVLVTIRTVMM